jgi:long-chain acyl-CoA synthetase
MHHIVNHSDSVLLICAELILDNLNLEHMPNLNAVLLLEDFSGEQGKKCPAINKALENMDELFQKKFLDGFAPDKINYKRFSNEALAEISYTSGTTGFSKGVMLSFNSLAANVLFAQRHMPLEAGDSLVSFLPLAHSYGCAFEFLFPVSLGCHIHFLTKTPSPATIIKAFQEVKPRLVLTVPLVIEKIYKKQILPKLESPALKFMSKIPGLNKVVFKKINAKLSGAFGGNFHEIVIGGAALSKDVELFLKKIHFRYTVGYGMTECGPLISYSSWETTKLHSAGQLVDTLEVKIDSDDPYNIVGEIMVKGENVMDGYYKNPKATRQVLEEDGWLHTGDLGLTDKDQTIFIKGRNKSMILGPSGQNIYPEEIEAKLNNMPYVQESLVIENENRLVAMIYPDFETADKENIDEKGLEEILENNRKAINGQLPGYMQLARVKLYPQEFEKTPKKSIKRFLYQDLMA